MQRFACAVAAVLASAVGVSAAITRAEAARLEAAARVVHETHATIPAEYWDRAHCIAVVPDLKKAAFIFGGEYGKGVMSCRSGDRWSAPVFMRLAKGSWGFQAEAEQVDVIMLVMNERGVQKLLENKVNLGADASIAAGPIGRQAHAGTDAYLTAEILSYSRAQGLFAGIDLSGGVLRPDEEANQDAYGPRATPRTVLASREISAPIEAAAFLNALGAQNVAVATTGSRATPSASIAAAANSPTPAAGSAPTGDTAAATADLRARVVEMQQTLDRLLSNAAASPVGTSGTTSDASTVSVSRAELQRLRQQLDQLMQVINSRR